MPTPQVWEVIKKTVQTVCLKRYDDYHDDLTKMLDKILDLESTRPPKFKQDIEKCVTTLGKRLVEQEGNLQ